MEKVYSEPGLSISSGFAEADVGSSRFAVYTDFSFGPFAMTNWRMHIFDSATGSGIFEFPDCLRQRFVTKCYEISHRKCSGRMVPVLEAQCTGPPQLAGTAFRNLYKNNVENRFCRKNRICEISRCYEMLRNFAESGAGARTLRNSSRARSRKTFATLCARPGSRSCEIK